MKHKIPTSKPLPLFADVIVEPKGNKSPVAAYAKKTGWIEKVHKVETVKRDFVHGGMMVAAVTYEHFVHFDMDSVCPGAWFTAQDLVIAPAFAQEA